MQASDSNPKGALDQESLRSLEAELEAHFPLPVEETELVLMEISPHRLYAYWHITPWEMESITRKLATADAKLVLRFHDLSEQNRAKSFDIEISGATGSRYVELWQDAKCYNAELGLVADKGQLTDLARSNTVEMPSAQASLRSGSQVLTLTPLADQLYLEPESAQEGDRRRREGVKTWQADEDQPNDPTLQAGIRELFPLFPDPLAPAFKPQRVELHLDLTETPAADAKTTIRLSEATRSPATADTPGPTAPTEELKVRAFREFPLCSVADAHALAKDGLIPLTPLSSLQAMASYLPTGFAFAPEANRQKAALRPMRDAVLGQGKADNAKAYSRPVSSFTLNEGVVADLSVQLHIEGHAQPNSCFIWHGQVIATGADGSFCIDERLSPDAITRFVAADRSRED